MSRIELSGLSKRFGNVVAVDDFSLTVEDGEFITLLGPSGCGKTTVLRMLAGLEMPDKGLIRIDDQVVYSSRDGIFVPPGKRNVGLVFQSYALWPHMTVFRNVAFGLEIAKTDRAETARRVGEALTYMQLQGMEERYPQQLSGGQQQRVALARMLVTGPSVFLMDEPLSNLDAKLRMEMRAEIKRLHRESRATTLYVTHDQDEALTLSTRVAVMDRGVLQQVDPPQRLYRKPANLFVADFIGSPTINFLFGTIRRSEDRSFLQGAEIVLVLPAACGSGGREIVAAVRPEDIQLSAAEGEDAVEIHSVLPAGADTIVQVKWGGEVLTARQPGAFAGDVGDRLFIRIPSEALNIYDKETGRLVC